MDCRGCKQTICGKYRGPRWYIDEREYCEKKYLIRIKELKKKPTADEIIYNLKLNLKSLAKVGQYDLMDFITSIERIVDNYEGKKKMKGKLEVRHKYT
jgi:hypothetical protein